MDYLNERLWAQEEKKNIELYSDFSPHIELSQMELLMLDHEDHIVHGYWFQKILLT